MKRIERDAYYTPRWAARQGVAAVLGHLGTGGAIVEPSAGGGAVVDALREHCPSAFVVALDSDPSAGPWANADVSSTLDFLTLPHERAFDLAIGNPPYKRAREFCEAAFEVANNVAFLLRLGFLASEERFDFWSAHRPSRLWVSPNRPSFAHGGTDSSDYAWILWQHGSTGPTVLDWLPPTPLDERKRK